MTDDTQAEYAREQADLVKADDHIAEAVARIERQEKLIWRLERDGHDIKQAEILLKTLKDGLKVMGDHRAQIVVEIARLEKKLSYE